MHRTLIAAAMVLMMITPTFSQQRAGSFGDDVAFLRKFTEVIELGDKAGQAKVALAPAWQGRVMTSTASGDAGASFGWINRELIASGKLQPHINVFGGEDRFWLGPEGGQFSIFFAKGAKFELADWQTPAAIDTMPYKVAAKAGDHVDFAASFPLTNYSGTQFGIAVQRRIQLIDSADIWKKLGVQAPEGVQAVAFESGNTITNTGKNPWKKETGLLSIWILGMFTPSPSTTIVVPIKPGPETELGTQVTSDYFGSIPADRLVVKDNVLFFSGDGKFRSKIGISPKRSKSVLGSYDADHGVLTVVQFTQPAGVTDYVNSLWKLQDNPFAGDAANSYNDGPPSPGAKPLGPFYELESSSPAAALAPGKSQSHVHRTIHLMGSETALDAVARTVLGVSLAEIKAGLKKPR
jgi:hypothetical protein